MSHHILPDAFGLTVLGNGILLVATALRDLGTTGYLVQERQLDLDKVRCSFTLSFIVTAIVTGLLIVCSAPIAQFYGDSRLEGFLRLMAYSYALGPFINPVIALLTRDMAFKAIAIINTGSALVGALVTIVMVRMGYGYVSVAWGGVAKAVAALIASFSIRREISVYQPSLKSWRGVLRYGVFGTSTAMIYTVGEAATYLLLGRIMDLSAVGLLQRAYMLTQVPERVVLAGVFAVAVPVFGRLSREGKPLAATYVLWIRLVAPVYMFMMLALVVLARPIVLILLGEHWENVILLVRIIALGHIIGLGMVLNAGVLVAVGGIRHLTVLALFQMTLLLACIALTAPLGIVAVSATAFFTVPVSTYSSYRVLRGWIEFSWTDLVKAGRDGLIASGVGIAPCAGLLMVPALSDRPVLMVGLSIAFGSIFWLLGLKFLNHPLFQEIVRIFSDGHRLMRRHSQAGPE